MPKTESQFTPEQWEKEMSQARVCGRHLQIQAGSCNILCPSCGTLGFYSPRGRQDEVGNVPRKYRACKFCGFWQEAEGKIYNKKGGAPYRCTMVQCSDCKTYDWRFPWQEDFGKCGNCKSNALRQVEWPTEDPSHLFHKIKEGIEKLHNQ